MGAFATLWSKAGRQLASPSGFSGRVFGALMSSVNRAPNAIAIDLLGPAASDTVLELGFGPGKAIKAIAARTPAGLVLGLDHSKTMLRQASQTNRQAVSSGKVVLQFGSFDALPWPDASVDKILAANVVYFFSESGTELREAKRVLRPGGTMVVYATDSSSMSKWKFASRHTHRLFDRETLRAFFLQAGFSDDEVIILSLKLPLSIVGLFAIVKKRSSIPERAEF